jgi:cation diffusion facilitator CzcD-associated flavoprotein CzcO
VDRFIVTGSPVSSCRWDDTACQWRVTTERGDVHESDAIVIATGQLHKPSVPQIEGAETFAGHCFHSAEWDHGYDLTDKRVAVVGTGASAVQFVPENAGQVHRLMVFQRTGNWFLPRKNRPYPAAFKALVGYVLGCRHSGAGSCSSTASR